MILYLEYGKLFIHNIQLLLFASGWVEGVCIATTNTIDLERGLKINDNIEMLQLDF